MAKYTNSFQNKNRVIYLVICLPDKSYMRKIGVLTFFVCLSSLAFAQRILPQVWFNENNISDNSIRVGDASMLYGLNGQASEIEGDYFWSQNFQKAKIYFYPQEYKIAGGGLIQLDSLFGVEVRFDIWNDRVEFKSEKGIKVVSAKKVSHVLQQGREGSISQFINPKEFHRVGLKGFLLILDVREERAFLQSKELLVQRPNYNPALDTGSKDYKIAKKAHFHYWNGSDIMDIDNKKDVTNLLESLGLDAKKYLKNSKNKLKSDEDYKDLAHFVFESDS